MYTANSSANSSANIETRVVNAKRTIRKHIPKIKNPQQRRFLEIEYCHHTKVISDYGFKFFPKHFILSSVEWLEKTALSFA